MSNNYYSKTSNETDMRKFSNSVNAYIFPNHIEGVGVSYDRHFRTKPEIKKEISELKSLPLSQEEYNRRLKKLKEELEGRSQIHPSKNFKKYS